MTPKHSRSLFGALAFLPVLAAVPLAHAEVAPSSPSIRVQDPDALEEDYEELLDAFDTAYAAWVEKVQSAEDEARQALWDARPEIVFTPRFRELAKSAGKTPAAADAWLWLFDRGKIEKDEKLGILETLVLDHIASPKMEKLAGSLDYSWYELGREPVENALSDIRSQSEHDGVLAAATYMLGRVHSAHDEADEALPLMREVVADYPETSWASRAERTLFELEKLQIGMLAPDFEAVDQDGVKFKLSDYRGKVVMLDFWGFW